MYGDLLAELADLDAFMAIWFSRINEHLDSEIATKLAMVTELEKRVGLAIGGSEDAAKWQKLLQYVSAMRATLAAISIPASGV